MQKHQGEIIVRAMEGNREAFRKLVEYYQHPAFTLTFRILCDEEDARDAVQEGFVKIWEHLDRYDQSHPFSSWLFRIMANCAIDLVRKRRRRKEVSMEQAGNRIERIMSEDQGLLLDNREIAQLIGFMAGELPEKQRLIFVLKDIQGMTVTEIRKILRISDTRLKSNLYYARKAIRKKFEKILTTERSIK